MGHLLGSHSNRPSSGVPFQLVGVDRMLHDKMLFCRKQRLDATSVLIDGIMGTDEGDGLQGYYDLKPTPGDHSSSSTGSDHGKRP